MNDFFIFEWFYSAIMAAVSTEILLHGHYRGEINNVNGCWSDWPSNLNALKAAVPKGGRPWKFQAAALFRCKPCRYR